MDWMEGESRDGERRRERRKVECDAHASVGGTGRVRPPPPEVRGCGEQV